MEWCATLPYRVIHRFRSRPPRMGCGGSTYQPDGLTDAPEEAAGQSGAPTLGAPALGDLRTSAYASANPRRSEVDYNRAQTHV